MKLPGEKVIKFRQFKRQNGKCWLCPTVLKWRDGVFRLRDGKIVCLGCHGTVDDLILRRVDVAGLARLMGVSVKQDYGEHEPLLVKRKCAVCHKRKWLTKKRFPELGMVCFKCMQAGG